MSKKFDRAFRMLFDSFLAKRTLKNSLFNITISSLIHNSSI